MSEEVPTTMIQTFSGNVEGTTVAVATLMVDGLTWFRGVDVTKALEYKNNARTLGDFVDPDFKTTLGELGNHTESVWLDRNAGAEVWINEFGVFQLVLKSKKPEARAFQRWVCSEVLPSIRKTGTYTDPRRQELETERLAIENNVARQRGEIEVANMARQALLNAYGKLDDAQEWAYHDRVSNVLRGEAAPSNQELTHAGLYLAEHMPAAQVRKYRSAFGRICARRLRAKLGTSDLPKAEKRVDGNPCQVVVFRVPQDLDVLEAGLRELRGETEHMEEASSSSEAPNLRSYFRSRPY
jgi:prophage antirepressor-like protein